MADTTTLMRELERQLEVVHVQLDELNADDNRDVSSDVHSQRQVSHRLEVLGRCCQKWAIKQRMEGLAGDTKAEIAAAKEHRGYEKAFKETAATRQTDLYEQIISLKNEEAKQADKASELQ